MARVLLDESIPRQVGPALEGHEVETVPGLGWAGIANGELLRRAAEQFDVLVIGTRVCNTSRISHSSTSAF